MDWGDKMNPDPAHHIVPASFWADVEDDESVIGKEVLAGLEVDPVIDLDARRGIGAFTQLGK